MNDPIIKAIKDALEEEIENSKDAINEEVGPIDYYMGREDLGKELLNYLNKIINKGDKNE